MKNLKYRLSKGFTLIELMVVISIISLLSSIVLASVKEVREKARATKFRAEVNQFINALELYKADKGVYPYENDYLSIQYSYLDNQNREFSIPVIGILLSSFISPKYLKSLPKVPTNSFNQSSPAWYYLMNPLNGNFPVFKCEGDFYIPKYTILFYNLNPTIFKIFSDLPIGLYSEDGIDWEDRENFKCFSLK
jgi:type II secretion system protein G